MATTQVTWYVLPPTSSLAGMTSRGDMVLGIVIPADGESSHWYVSFAASEFASRQGDALALTKKNNKLVRQIRILQRILNDR